MDDLSIALPIFEGAEEQDVVGPFEMLIAMGGRGRWAAIPRYFLALLTCVTMLGAERGPSLSVRATKRRSSESRNETTNCKTRESKEVRVRCYVSYSYSPSILWARTTKRFGAAPTK